MQSTSETDNLLVISYLTLRKAIGLLGIALPFIISIGALLLFQTGLQDSISNYYYTCMRNVLVGILCAIGVFLLSYKGYERKDDIAGDLACAFAVGVALFPTRPPDSASSLAETIGTFHFIFAASFFLTLSYFSLFLFTKTNPEGVPSRRKLQRNKVYRVCGFTMVLCLLLILIEGRLPNALKESLKAYHPVFWLESIAVVAFGISWLTKGEAILKDEP